MTAARQVFPDRLRGVALLGIVVVNAPFLGISNDGFTAASIAAPADAVAAFLVITLAQGKFYLLLSFLFGYSSLFILRDGSPANRRRFRRRLIALGVIGFLHAVFFFIGDILLTYALLGFGLLAVSRQSDRALRTWVFASALLGAALLALILVPLALLDPSASEDTISSFADLNTALTDGSFLQAAGTRLAALPVVLLVLLLFQGAFAFGAFCIGLLAARRQALADAHARVSLWRRLAIIGLGVGLPLQIIAALWQLQAVADPDANPQNALGTGLGFLTAPVLSAGYVGLLGLILTRRPQALRLTEAPGRTSLSVYIGESAVLSLLFCGYGLGFFGTWGALPVVLAGVLSWLTLALIAHFWLRRFRQGPLEWLVGQWTTREHSTRGVDSPAH